MFFSYIKKWWYINGWGVIFFGSILTLFLLWFFYSRHCSSGTSNANWQDILQTIFHPTPEPIHRFQQNQQRQPFSSNSFMDKTSSQGEKICKEFMEFLTGKPFVKVRPSFLKNPVTNHSLELDLYNEEMRLAIEYNGSQHYHFNSKMHASRDSFHNQKYRDLIKKQLCDQHGITLIHVPYTVPHDKIPLFLYDELKRIKFI